MFRAWRSFESGFRTCTRFKNSKLLNYIPTDPPFDMNYLLSFVALRILFVHH